MLLALMSIPGAALATDPGPVVATNPERETGYTDLGECRKALEATAKPGLAGASGTTGSLFNQAQGNVSRCELVQGEVLVVVYPRGSASSD